ncbi:MAG: efflux transporter, RND family, MFP subunit [Candidatus Accumulibacter adjunctus]|uniref:Efflux transporter, RND family, MFP subunit n=1 Tax=Candidatus Accumulibacter adjunctus TaxID=1454001 RepID=A0A011NRN9_9PROT|nr:MAG: efflux transporter, RND family, MFP subunit [Candidatus Accumulibacter adjunctus]
MKHRVLIAAIGFLIAASLNPVIAGEGHDHGDAPPAASGNGPKRLPDGSVFLPKPAQRQLNVRTQAVVAGELPRAFELNGRVMMDPNAGGKVQAIVAGRVTPGPKGLPYAGQAVVKGEVLAYVTPEVGGNSRSLNESRLRRLRELSDTVPRKLIEEAEAAVANEQLRAPVSGVIASSSVVSGQVVEAREVLFEIVNPERLLIEALAFDPAIGNDIARAFIAVGDDSLPLRLVGVARSLREQALPLTFRGEGKALAVLAVGQPVSVFVQTRGKVAGIAVPAAALMRNPANQNIVWVKTAPEHFAPRVVTSDALDGNLVAITSGLQAGDLVVVRAAGLINQVR